MPINEFLEKWRHRFSLKGILLVIVFIYLIPKSIFRPPGLGLDSSWMLSLNMALAQGLVWGKDIIFTYGPLGYLSTGMPFEASKVLIVFFYIFIVANGFYFIYYTIKSKPEKKDYIFLFVIFFCLGYFLFLRDAITLYFYFLFHVFHYVTHRNRVSFFVLSIIAILAFFIKVNVGIVLNGVLLYFIAYNSFFGDRKKLQNVLFAIIHFIAIVGFSWLLNVDILLYVKNSISIINSYNDAMVIVPSKMSLYGALIIIGVITVALISCSKIILRNTYELFIFSNILLIGFILFKQSFVRADGHIIGFYSGISFILITAHLFVREPKLKKAYYYLALVVPIVSISFLDKSIAWVLKDQIGYALFESKNTTSAYSLNSKKRKLPTRIIDEIGESSVDVLGYETSFLFYNDLTYQPRPVFQSYQAYNSTLIESNYRKYTSSDAPDFVLYHIGSIDNRHPFWDEPKTYLSIFQNYEICDTVPVNTAFSHQLIVFKKTNKLKGVNRTVVLDTIAKFDTKINIPTSENMLYLEIDFDYTLAGKARRIMYQPALIEMSLMYEDFDSSTYRLVVPVMSSGVPINSKVLNDKDALTFFESNGDRNVKTKSFQLKGNHMWFNDSFNVRFIEYKLDK